jgi:hypothetical protein
MLVTLNDGSTPVTLGSITLTINGLVVTPTIVQTNGITTITFDRLTAGAQTNILVYSTSTGGPFTNTWTFTETVSSTTPTLSVGKQGTSYVITYTGVLRSCATANGTYNPVSGASSPYTIPTGAAPMMFYRAYQN